MEIERLFYELASESRLSILEALKEKDCKMNDLSRNLDLSTTETFRQLQRLSEASLARKQPEGTYAITEYGKLVLGFSSPLGFLLKNKQFFLTHDVQCLPAKFIMRLEILSQATFLSGMVESTTKISNMIGQAKYFMWAISPEPLFQSLEDISKEIPKGAQYRVMSPQPYMKLPNIENRTLSEPPLILALTEKQAAVCFRLIDGKVDYTCFFGEASGFHEWVKDLFCYFWDRGNRV
ncbi:MAG: ArsR family transcriptional regulator [Candidatus Bathyarchaeota archaeon]|nr:ArsR family transcriptional regulator [Candidatus Bathyarchaeota archaeon]